MLRFTSGFFWKQEQVKTDVLEKLGKLMVGQLMGRNVGQSA